MISRLTLIIAGVLSIISAWLPWVELLGESHNGFMGDYGGNPGLFFIVLGAIILGMGALNKKWSAVVAILFSILVCMLGLKYYNDSTTGDALIVGAKVGSGVYCMIFAGFIGIVGGIMRFFVKKKVAVAAAA
ncbi:hypothetical protein [Edaphocola aurantiacus]|uniref:hypothetical protein n=1 Tax=Edaphocola aurantiacus TaxID=2601682 RepID=UPI001C93D7F3|nr:hypothetical protein [Edaphocola aurantiacus]